MISAYEVGGAYLFINSRGEITIRTTLDPSNTVHIQASQ